MKLYTFVHLCSQTCCALLPSALFCFRPACPALSCLVLFASLYPAQCCPAKLAFSHALPLCALLHYQLASLRANAVVLSLADELLNCFSLTVVT